MAVKRIAAETLIDLAIETIRKDLQPGLSPDQRFRAAMIANALEIARREILTDGESAQWDLLDLVYDDGEGTLTRLGGDIRSGKVSSKSHPQLPEKLKSMLIDELRVRNPRFLKTRDISS
jgi:Domain of unknown function (DUF6285)